MSRSEPPTASDDQPEEFSDEEYDAVFNQLKAELIDSKELPTMNQRYYCKICGLEKTSQWGISSCFYCQIPVCRKCRSHSFCLNCILDMEENSRKTLKMLRFFIWSVPLFTLFLIVYGWLQFLVIELIIISLLTSLFLFFRRYIKQHSDQIFSTSWRTTITSPEYDKYMNLHSPTRFYNQAFVSMVDRQKNQRIEKLRNWIDPPLQIPSDSPDPSTISVSPSISQIEDHHEIFVTPNTSTLSSSSIAYSRINTPCPHCQNPILFADFCPECNIKFCPQCGNENNPQSTRCICGFSFPNLINEFEFWQRRQQGENPEMR